MGELGRPGTQGARRVANHERGPPFGKEIRLHDLHSLRQSETLEVLARAHQRARLPVGGDYMHDTPPREHGGQHPRPGADVEGHAGRWLAGWGQRSGGDQIDVFGANRRKHSVVGMDAAADRCDFNSLDAPLMRADDPQQRSQRDD